jgi:hypothetical protein
MKVVKEQKEKLEQRKNKLALEEAKLKMKERKMRTRRLIEIGGLVLKASIDHLPTNTLYGAFLYISNSLKNDLNFEKTITEIGKNTFDKEQSKYTPIILKFDEQPDSEIRKIIRSYGLKWNNIRSEWYGNIKNIDELKTSIKNIKYSLEIIK